MRMQTLGPTPGDRISRSEGLGTCIFKGLCSRVAKPNLPPPPTTTTHREENAHLGKLAHLLPSGDLSPTGGPEGWLGMSNRRVFLSHRTNSVAI